MKDISGKVAIVTGSASGVGAATARLLAAQGCHVVINYSRSASAAAAVAEQCRRAGADVLICRADVADDASCREMVAQALSKWGRVDILVNNAGTTRFCDHDNLEGLHAEDFQSIYGVNVIGPYQMIRAAAASMRAQPEGGVVVNVASTAALTGIGSSVAYAASKGALVTMTLSLARALGPHIRINAVCPGFIQGDWLRDGLGAEKYEALKNNLERNAPLRTTASPETVAEAILHFITGPRIITGETLIVDGGQHLNTVPLGRR